MARYTYTHLLKHIDAALVTLPTYFIALDVAANIRDETGKNQDVKRLREVMIKHDRAERTGVVIKRCGYEWALLKRPGAPDPDEDFEYGRKGA